MKQRFWLVALAICAILAAPAAAAAAGVPKFPKLWSSSRGDLVVKPSAIDWTGDGSGFFTGRGTMARHGRIRWTKWDSREATGYGNAQVLDCVPSCAASKFGTHPVKLTLYRPARSHGQLIFTRWRYTFLARVPPGFRRTSTLKAGYKAANTWTNQGD